MLILRPRTSIENAFYADDTIPFASPPDDTHPEGLPIANWREYVTEEDFRIIREQVAMAMGRVRYQERKTGVDMNGKES